MSILQNGNNKLSKAIAHYGRMPGLTCPEACDIDCWAKKFARLRPNVRSCWIRNSTRSDQAHRHVLADDLAQLPRSIKAFRVNTTGDFCLAGELDLDHIHGTIEGITDARLAGLEIPGWFYTRAWSIAPMPDLAEAFRDIGIETFASIQHIEDAHLAKAAGFRLAFCDINEEKRRLPDPTAPKLTRRSGHRFRTCKEQLDPTMTCDRCAFCWTPSGARIDDVRFLYHV